MGKKLDRLYIRVDANFPEDERYLALPKPVRDSAYLFFEALNGWSRDKKTDGRVPVAVAQAKGRQMEHAPAKVAAFIDALAQVGLLVREGDELVIPKYAKWQDTREEMEQRSEVRREAGRRGGLASGQSKREAIATTLLEPQAKQNEAETETETETETEPLTTVRGEGPPVPPSGAERAVFEAWRESTGARRAVLTEKRRKTIRARLREGYSEEDLTAAVRGWINDPWPERVQHNDLDQLLRDGAHVEKFRDLHQRGPATATGPARNGQGHRVDTPATLQARRLEALAVELEARGE